MPVLSARLMGTPSLAVDGAPVRVPSAKALALLAYLLVNRQAHSRDRLAGLFWPDVPDRRAQASLRTALYDIRKALGASSSALLAVDRTRIGVAEGAQVDLDVARLEAVGCCDGADDPQVLGAAVDAYRGPFLEGVSFSGAYDAEDWAHLERERLSNLYASALCRLAEHHAASNELELAIDLSRRLLAVDPLREDVHRALMRHLARSGQRSAALAQYAACADALRRELDVEPLAATTELFEQIRDSRALSEEGPAPGPLARAAARVSSPPAVLEAQARAEGVLVGRGDEIEQLRSAWQRAASGTGSVIGVEGEAGVGKTRLLAEIAQEATRDGIVLWGRCHESTIAEPYGPFVEVVRGAASTVDLAALDLPDLWRHELARLVPELATDLPREPASPLDGVRDRERLFEGVRSFVASIAARQPALLAIEDVHWADETSLSLVTYLARAAASVRVLVVVTFRGEELGTERRDAVRRLLMHGRKLGLGPLDEEQTTHLVQGLAGGDRPAAFGRALHRATGGNAFFLVEVLRALFEQGSLQDDDGRWRTTAGTARDAYEQLPVPESVELIVAGRLSRLRDDARHLLECAAVLRRDFEFDVVAAVSRLESAEALDALDELLGSGLLREQPLQPGALTARYDFNHALVRDHVYAGLSGARRQHLHRQIAGLMETARPVAADRVAYHYLRGGVRDRACQWSLRAGGVALSVYAGESALVHFRSARELAIRPEEEHAALAGLGDAFVGLGRHEEAIRCFAAALDHTADAEARADLLRRIGRAHERQGAFDKALEALGRARQSLHGRPLSLTSVRIADSLATVYVRLGRHEDAAELCGDALRWLREHPDTDGVREAEAWLCNTHGMALLHAGDIDGALASLERGLELKRALEDRLGEATLLNNLGVVHYHSGDDAAAREHYGASLEIKAQIGDAYGRAIALTNLALIETHLGDHEASGRLLADARQCAEDVGAAWLMPEIERVAAQRSLALGDLDAARDSAESSLAAAEELGVPSFIGVAHRVLGLVKAAQSGDAGACDEHFQTSLAVFEMLANDHEMAKTHAAYGEALVMRGRASDAQAHLRAAASVFERSGASGRRQRLDPLLGP